MWRQTLAPFPNAGIAYDEPFTYANGTLLGKGNWLNYDSNPDLVIASNSVTTDSSGGGYQLQSAGLVGFDPTAGWSVEMTYLCPATILDLIFAANYLGESSTDYVGFEVDVDGLGIGANIADIIVYANHAGVASVHTFSSVAFAFNASHVVKLTRAAGVLTLVVDGSTIGTFTPTVIMTAISADIILDLSSNVWPVMLKVDRLKVNQPAA